MSYSRLKPLPRTLSANSNHLPAEPVVGAALAANKSETSLNEFRELPRPIALTALALLSPITNAVARALPLLRAHLPEPVP